MNTYTVQLNPTSVIRAGSLPIEKARTECLTRRRLVWHAPLSPANCSRLHFASTLQVGCNASNPNTFSIAFATCAANCVSGSIARPFTPFTPVTTAAQSQYVVTVSYGLFDRYSESRLLFSVLLKRLGSA